MKSRSYDRRAFLRLGAGITAGVSMGISAERKALAGGPISSLSQRPSAEAGRSGRLSNSPAAQTSKALRPLGIFFANHKQDTGLHLWDLQRWKREIDDTRRMGANAIWFLPFQFGQHSPKDFEDMAPHWTLQRALCRAVADTGLEVGFYQGLNDVFPETWNKHPEWHAVRGDYMLGECQVCPSVPEARQELLRLRERLYAGLPRIDYIVTQITDYGGCGCDMCAPYPKTYLKALEEQSALARRYHPGVKMVASGLSASSADNDMLRDLLPKMTWADNVWELPRGPKPAIKASMPETSMVGGWGEFGPCPILAEIKRVYEYDYGHFAGVAQYCEGIHDDVNRFALLQFAQDPRRTVEDVARAYAEDWLKLSGRSAEQVGEVIAGLGTEISFDRFYGSLGYGADNPQADERVRILVDVRTQSRGLEDNFRYWLLHYRAVCESFSTVSGSLTIEMLRKEAEAARAAFLRLEPEYAQFIAKLDPNQLPGRIEWNWPRTIKVAFNRERSFS